MRTAASATQKLQRAVFHAQGALQSRLGMNAPAVFSLRQKSSSFRGPIQSSVDETWEQRRDVVSAETWASAVPERSSLQSSIDETWEQRRAVASAQTWADAVPARSSFQSSVDETWETRREVVHAETWASKGPPGRGSRVEGWHAILT